MIDYMLMETVAARVAKEDQEAAKRKKVEDWKKDETGLDHLKKVAGET